MARKNNKKPSQRAIAAIKRDHPEVPVTMANEGYAELCGGAILVDHSTSQLTCEDLEIWQMGLKHWSQDEWVMRILEIAAMVRAKKEITG